MLSQLDITNFRGIRRLSADVSHVTALLGPNSSGKTTVLHAIRTACALFEFALSDAHAGLKMPTNDSGWFTIADQHIVPSITPFVALTDWRALFNDQRVDAGIESTLQLSFAGVLLDAIETTLTVGRNSQLKLRVRIQSQALTEQTASYRRLPAHRATELLEQIRQHAPRAVFVPPFYGTVLNEEYRARAAINRELGSGNQHHVVRNLVSGLDASRFARLNSFLSDTLGAKLTYRTSGDRLQTESPLKVLFSDSNGPLELSAAGAGLTNLIALYSALSRWRQDEQTRPFLFLLDEPEAHLSPKLQAESAVRIAQLVTQEFGAQLVLATHSVDILNRLFEDGASLLRVDRTATPSVTQIRDDAGLFEDLASWADLTPYTAINALAARRVLFCEGVTDQTLIPLLAGLRYRDDPARLRALRKWSVVKLDGTGNTRMAPLLNRLLQSDAVRTTSGQPAFRIELVLDRDYERVPGTTQADGLTQTVWACHSIESLFIEPALLTLWIRALLGPTAPANISDLVQDAINTANADQDLNDAASGRRASDAIQALAKAGASLHADHGRALTDAIAAARAEVHSHPESWQRGKDRAQFVLGHIRARLPAAHSGHFPTSVLKLIQRVNPNDIGQPLAAIPTELRTLIERLGSEP